MPQAWLTLFTDHEQALITASRRFTNGLAPVLLPDHQAMIVISKLAATIDQLEKLNLALLPTTKDKPT